MKSKVTMKTIVNVLGPDNLRIGIIAGRKETKFFGLITSQKFCFQGRNGNTPAFYGWCDSVEDVEKFVKERFPDSCYGISEEGIDKMLDKLEDMMQ